MGKWDQFILCKLSPSEMQNTFSAGSKCFLVPQGWQQRWKMKLSEERGEGVNENLSVVYKPLLNSPEAMEDFARPLTPLQRLKHVAQLPEKTRGGRWQLSDAFLLSHNSSTYWEHEGKWTEVRGDRRRWWPVKYKGRKLSEREEYFKR